MLDWQNSLIGKVLTQGYTRNSGIQTWAMNMALNFACSPKKKFFYLIDHNESYHFLEILIPCVAFYAFKNTFGDIRPHNGNTYQNRCWQRSCAAEKMKKNNKSDDTFS